MGPVEVAPKHVSTQTPAIAGKYALIRIVAFRAQYLIYYSLTLVSTKHYIISLLWKIGLKVNRLKFMWDELRNFMLKELLNIETIYNLNFTKILSYGGN